MSKRILIAPLDWGLGHATRCVPLIRYLLETGHVPVIASAGRPLQLLRDEFPEVEYVELEGYNISYPTGSGMAWKMFRSTPRIIARIKKEHEELQLLVPDLQLDAVISDNRFGLYTDLVPCVYITHQVMIKAPFFEGILHRLHSDYMRRFTSVWVSDSETDGLSGDLGHKYELPFNGEFIGPLSRFERTDVSEIRDVLLLISGPEPQRTRFETMILEQLEQFKGSAMAVLGKPESLQRRINSMGHVIVDHLGSKELQKAIAESRLVISRSGYSTIMDLSVLGKKAVFVPTPGQTEQEYLARKYHAEKKHLMMDQNDFDLNYAVESAADFSGFEQNASNDHQRAINALIGSLSQA